jgi:hypothetical protein
MVEVVWWGMLRVSIVRSGQQAGRSSTSTKSELEEQEHMREKEAGGSLAARLKGTSQDTIVHSQPIQAIELLFRWPSCPPSGSYAPS